MSLLRRVTDFILQSRSRAFGLAFVCAYIPLLGSISILIAGLVTLRKGALEGAIILFGATAPFIINYYVAQPVADQAGMALIAIVGVILSNLLVWSYAILLRQYSNWSLILEYSVLLSIVAIGAVHFFVPDIQAWWGTQLTAYIAKATTEMTANGLTSVDLQRQVQAVNAVKPIGTGMIVLSILLNGLLQLLLVRWWEKLMFVSGNLLRQELYQIRFGFVVGILFIATLLLSYWGKNATAIDLSPVLFCLFFIAGLSLMHCLLAPAKYNWLWLVLVYIALIVLFPKSIMVVAVFALLDVLLDLRRRLTRV